MNVFAILLILGIIGVFVRQVGKDQQQHSLIAMGNSWLWAATISIFVWAIKGTFS